MQCKPDIQYRGVLNIPIPMALGVLVQWCKHNRQYDFDIVTDQIAKVLIIPEIKRSLRNL